MLRLAWLFVCAFSILFQNSAFAMHPLHKWVEDIGPKHFSEHQDEFRDELRKYTDKQGRVTSELQAILSEMQLRFFPVFNESARADFQDRLADIGAKHLDTMQLPRRNTPFWLLEKGPLHNYRSHAKFPTQADVVIIGAGLTGASAAYHLSQAALQGKSIVVLEEGQIASQSSGKNGGNFQLLPESYVGDYTGMVEEREKWLTTQHPEWTAKHLREVANRQAKVLFSFSYKNFLRFSDIIEREKIECDFSPKGWLKLALTADEEEALRRDTTWMLSMGIDAGLELWSPEFIRQHLFIDTPFEGRFVPKNGNYHPYKFVTELLSRSLSKGVQLYTRVKVLKIKELNAGGVLIQTSKGPLKAAKVIVATNSATPKLLADLSEIKTHESMIINLEHVEDRTRGMTITEHAGDIYYHFPKSKQYHDGQVARGMLHYGLDFDESIPDQDKVARIEPHFRLMKDFMDERFPDTVGQPASRFWIGPMGFTKDRTPLIGFYHSPEHPKHQDIVVAAAFQGYGGSFCTQAGYVAAQMALSGQVHADVPEEVFSPLRFR